MKITLAWPQDDLGDAGETVDAPDDRARVLISDGYARLPDSLGHLSSAEIDTVAALEGVDISGASTVTEKTARVKAARAAKEG